MFKMIFFSSYKIIWILFQEKLQIWKIPSDINSGYFSIYYFNVFLDCLQDLIKLLIPITFINILKLSILYM